jgi:hypothetical protein
MDLSKLSDADLAAVQAGDMSKVSDEGLALISGKSTPKSRVRAIMDASRDTAAGLLRGAGSIGATLVSPTDILSDAMAGRPLMQSNRERRAAMDAALGTLGADTNSTMYGLGKTAAEIAGTAGAGGMLARGATMAGVPANVARLLEAGGLVRGGNYGAKVAAGAAAGGAGAPLPRHCRPGGPARHAPALWPGRGAGGHARAGGAAVHARGGAGRRRSH